MKGSEKKLRRGAQLELVLEKLFYNELFIEDIRQLREHVGIPEKGFETFTEYYEYLKCDFESAEHFWPIKLKGGCHKLADKYNLAQNYAYWIEAFCGLGFKYEGFKPETPYPNPREYTVYGLGTSLDILQDNDRVRLDIFPGATLNSTIDFIRENWPTIEMMLETKSVYGKVPPTRKVRNRDRLQILKMYDNGEIDSTGVWSGSRYFATRPECIENLGTRQINKIITDEKRKREIREGKRIRK